MNGSSVPAGSEVDEFELAGLKPQIGKFVSAPFVVASLAFVVSAFSASPSAVSAST